MGFNIKKNIKKYEEPLVRHKRKHLTLSTMVNNLLTGHASSSSSQTHSTWDSHISTSSSFTPTKHTAQPTLLIMKTTKRCQQG